MRAPPLDLRPIEVCEAVFVEKCLTNAAAMALGQAMRQPAVSQVLGRLRAHFGDPLFLRMVGGMEATSRAKELFAPVGVILKEARESLADKPAFEPAREYAE